MIEPANMIALQKVLETEVENNPRGDLAKEATAIVPTYKTIQKRLDKARFANIQGYLNALCWLFFKVGLAYARKYDKPYAEPIEAEEKRKKPRGAAITIKKSEVARKLIRCGMSSREIASVIDSEVSYVSHLRAAMRQEQNDID